ncbi:hypothetical protein [Rhizobacter sp. P5_C2]|jgi:hypothetical protein
MKPSILLLSAALAWPFAAMADHVTVNFTARVLTSSGTRPPVGATFTGAYVFDSNPAAYTQWPDPTLPGYLGYETFASTYGLTMQWPSGPIDFTQGGGVTVEVFDNGTSPYPLPVAGDATLFGVKRSNVIYRLSLFGPATSFTGSALPTEPWLSGQWTSGTFTIRDQNIFSTVLTAEIIGTSVSSLPD